MITLIIVARCNVVDAFIESTRLEEMFPLAVGADPFSAGTMRHGEMTLLAVLTVMFVKMEVPITIQKSRT